MLSDERVSQVGTFQPNLASFIRNEGDFANDYYEYHTSYCPRRCRKDIDTVEVRYEDQGSKLLRAVGAYERQVKILRDKMPLQWRSGQRASKMVLKHTVSVSHNEFHSVLFFVINITARSSTIRS